MKKNLISVFILILILSISNVVNAVSASINLGASSEAVNVGEIFTVTVIGTADSNIKAFQADLSYDESKLSIEKRIVAEGFADFSETDEIAIAASNNDGLSQTTTLYTITFKVLDTANPGDTTINFKNVSIGVIDGGSASIEDDDVTIEIKETINKSETSNKVSNTTNTNKDSSKLPQTGVESVSLLAITILSIIAYVSYKKYKNI